MTGVRAIHLEEPTLTFGYGQTTVYPKEVCFFMDRWSLGVPGKFASAQSGRPRVSTDFRAG